MKQRSHVEMRMQFLEAGDKLGFPRLGYGPGRRVAMGEGAWTAFASSAPLSRLAPALRNATMLASYYGQPAQPETVVDDVRARRIAGLAKARAAKAAKKEAAV